MDMDMAMATSTSDINLDNWEHYTPETTLPALVDNQGHLLTALALGLKGSTPHRWLVDLAFHEIGLNPHGHVFYHQNPPPEAKEDIDTPLSICCQTCFKLYTVYINRGDVCGGQTHHLHTKFSEDSVVSECCHCGLQITASLETPALPQSLLYRIRTARQPKVSSLTNAPFFVDTLETLIRILQGAAQPEKPGVPNSINTGSKAFTNKVSLDNDIKEFFRLTGFTFSDNRFHPPERSVATLELLSRATMQMQLLLSQEKSTALTGLTTAFQAILSRMDVANYFTYEGMKKVDLASKPQLMKERDSALGKLGCLSSMDDDLVLDALQSQIDHDVTKAHILVDALLEIQQTRKSERLDFEIVRLRSEHIVSTTELRAAYRDFEIGESGDGISTEVLIGLLRASLHTATFSNLEIIVKSRKDLELGQILESPYMPLEDIPQEDPILDMYYAQNPVGLANIGNTCYLNSLLQYIYTIKEIRETVLNMDAYVENEDDPNWKEKVIDGRTLSRQDVAEVKEIVFELKKLFTLMQTAKARSVTPSARLVELLLSTGKDGLTDASGTRNPGQFFEQQDVSETMSILMYRLNAAFQPITAEEGGSSIDRFYKLFYAKASRRASHDKKHSAGGSSQERITEDFNTLLLNVQEDTTMEELVDGYFDAGHQHPPPQSPLGSQSSSSRVHIPRDLIDSSQGNDITVTELPPILHIHLMRTQFDRIDKRSFKSNAKVSIPKRLYLDQYLESFHTGDETRVKRIRLWKEERSQHHKVLDSLLAEKKSLAMEIDHSHPTKENTPGETLYSIEEDGASEDNSTLLSSDAPEATMSVPDDRENELDALEAKKKEQLEKIERLNRRIQDEVKDLASAEYKIHAVFHHEGGVNFGHYWVYILDESSNNSSSEGPSDHEQQPRWLKYSDDVVSEVGKAQEDEVFNGLEGSTACFCVYVRNNALDVVQTIARSIA
ncbi:hypothetical protein EMPS_02328 [Entomortierella parvispora]|uniref:ubiquitinyl hydrolase 1 n=1 Tax=Entomortierella parvispora TaxID=205924 RepID=A0A9P3H4N8_9FUNG|nr:hypothetical protein EMPS_02328 [Entomortierella parvispora]